MADTQYLDLMRKILRHGFQRENERTGHVTHALFGESLHFNLQHRFPLLTTKKVWFKGVIAELLWFLSGSTNVRDLHKHDCHIWDDWCDMNGDLGPIYGHQWRSWNVLSRDLGGSFDAIPHDQIQWLVNRLRSQPFDRGHIVSAWNVGDLEQMALRPCHTMFQMLVDSEGRLHCIMHQRSADYFIGVPFNIASYALLTHLIAHVCELTPGSLQINFGDVHIYRCHVPQCNEQIKRQPKAGPKLELNAAVEDIDDFRLSDIRLFGYDPHPAIEGEVVK